MNIKTKLLSHAAKNLLTTPAANRMRKQVTNIVTKNATDWFLRNGAKILTKEFMVTMDMVEADNRSTYNNFLRWLKNNVSGNSIISSNKLENDLFSLSGVPTFFRYKKFAFWVTQEADKDNQGMNIAHIKMFGRNDSIMRDLYEEFRHKPSPKASVDDDGEFEFVEINVYKSQIGGEWEHQTEIHPRRFDTIVVPHDIKDDLMTKLKHFKDSEDFYKERGLAYKLGLILHGEPGTGKTSIIKAIATYLNYDIYELNFRHVNNENILKCLRNTSRDSIIVIEEFDACGKIADISKREGIDELYAEEREVLDPKTGKVTTQRVEFEDVVYEEEVEAPSEKYAQTPEQKKLKGHFKGAGQIGYGARFAPPPPRLDLGELLKSFDGLIPLDNRVIIMTSNMFKKMEIDPALTRKGRIDGIYELKKFGQAEIVEYAEKMFPGKKVPEGVKFEKILGCDIQDTYMDNKFNFELFIHELPKAEDSIVLQYQDIGSGKFKLTSSIINPENTNETITSTIETDIEEEEDKSDPKISVTKQIENEVVSEEVGV